MEEEKILSEFKGLRTFFESKIAETENRHHELDKAVAVNKCELDRNLLSVASMGKRIGHTEHDITDRVQFKDLEDRFILHKTDNCKGHAESLGKLEKKVDKIPAFIVVSMSVAVAIITAVLVGITAFVAIRYGGK